MTVNILEWPNLLVLDSEVDVAVLFSSDCYCVHVLILR